MARKHHGYSFCAAKFQETPTSTAGSKYSQGSGCHYSDHGSSCIETQGSKCLVSEGSWHYDCCEEKCHQTGRYCGWWSGCSGCCFYKKAEVSKRNMKRPAFGHRFTWQSNVEESKCGNEAWQIWGHGKNLTLLDRLLPILVGSEMYLAHVRSLLEYIAEPKKALQSDHYLQGQGCWEQRERTTQWLQHQWGWGPQSSVISGWECSGRIQRKARSAMTF